MKKIYLLVIASIGFAACDNNNEEPVISPVTANISATIGERLLTRAADKDWAKGDDIGITTNYGERNVLRNVKYTTPEGNGAFTGQALYIYNPMSLTAYYPFKGPEGSDPGIITESTDADKQTSENQPSIDFLYASKEGITSDKPDIVLNFTHQMSKLTFIFKNGAGMNESKIAGYEISGLILKGTFNTADGKCAADSGEVPGSIGLTLPEGSVKPDETFSSLIVFPQSLEGSKVTLTITDSEDQVYACELNFTNSRIISGNNYQWTVTVNKTGLNVNEFSITEWSTEQGDADASSVLTDPSGV